MRGVFLDMRGVFPDSVGYFQTPKVDLTNSLLCKKNFGELLIHLGGEQILIFVDTKWARLLLLLTQGNSNNLIVTLVLGVFPVTSGSSRRVQKMEIMVQKVM